MMQAAPHPVFITGCHRSGSTLLRYLLDAHPELACAPESKFIAGVEAFIRYPQALEGLHSLGLTDQQVRRLLRGLIEECLTFYAAQQGKPRWIDKTPNYARMLPFIDELFEHEAHYLLMLRHPFD